MANKIPRFKYICQSLGGEEMAKRIKTKYPGVFYREAQRKGWKGTERVYYVVFKKNGKVHEEKVGRQYENAMTPAKAARIRAERIEGKRRSPKEIREAAKAKAKRYTISRLWEEFKKQKQGELKTFDDYAYDYHKFIEPNFGDKEPDQIHPLDIDRFKRRVMKGKAPSTIRNKLALLSSIINFGASRRLCPPLPFKIARPRVENETTEDLTPEQLSRLLEVLNSDPNYQVAGAMKMALFTGMRASEIFGLQWRDIGFQRGFIHIRDPKSGTDQKIPLNDVTRNLLENHPRTSKYIFPGRGGRRRQRAEKAANRIKAAAGLPKDFRPFHGLRHVYASMLASSGEVDLYTLQKLLTHKSPQMTQRYAHLRDDALKRASNLAGALIDEVVNGKERAEDQSV
jgi:integrase